MFAFPLAFATTGSFPPLFLGPLAQVGPHFLPTPPWTWFCLGLGLCGLEFRFRHRIAHRYRYIATLMGLSAVVLAIILWRAAAVLGLMWRTLMVQDGALSLQVLYWMGLAFTAVIWVRPMFHRPRRSAIPQSTEAQTLTELQPGQLGRVLYEGCSWQACCENYPHPIPPQQRVFVLHREGNLLFVAPDDLFKG